MGAGTREAAGPVGGGRGGGIADLAREAGARLNTSATVTAMTTLPDKAGWMRARP
jgi:hypothetical protein